MEIIIISLFVLVLVAILYDGFVFYKLYKDIKELEEITDGLVKSLKLITDIEEANLSLLEKLTIWKKKTMQYLEDQARDLDENFRIIIEEKKKKNAK